MLTSSLTAAAPAANVRARAASAVTKYTAQSFACKSRDTSNQWHRSSEHESEPVHLRHELTCRTAVREQNWGAMQVEDCKNISVVKCITPSSQ